MIRALPTPTHDLEPTPPGADAECPPRPTLVLLRGGRHEAPRPFVVAPPAVSAVAALAASAAQAAFRLQSRERRAAEVDPFRCRLAGAVWR